MNDISQDEIIARFIFDRKKKYFSPVDKTVQFKTFMPTTDREDPTKYNPDLSVCRISVLSGNGVMPNDKIWKIGQKIGRERQPSRTLKARADLVVSKIYENNLKVIPDPQPYKEHANITPFPPDELGCLRLATKLADVSKLKIIPSVQTES